MMINTNKTKGFFRYLACDKRQLTSVEKQEKTTIPPLHIIFFKVEFIFGQ